MSTPLERLRSFAPPPPPPPPITWDDEGTAYASVKQADLASLLALVEQQEKALREIVALATWGTDNRMAARSIAAAALASVGETDG